jgi:hypothetical protein
LLKNPFSAYVVIPAGTGIQSFQCLPDYRLRGSDAESEFFRILLKFAEGIGVIEELIMSRWMTLRPWKTTLINQLIVLACYLDISPSKIYRWYQRNR